MKHILSRVKHKGSRIEIFTVYIVEEKANKLIGSFRDHEGFVRLAEICFRNGYDMPSSIVTFDGRERGEFIEEPARKDEISLYKEAYNLLAGADTTKTMILPR